MKNPPLVQATLIKRYKRFLVDAILLETGETVTAHCPNSGSMRGLIKEGGNVYLSLSTNPKNKLKYKLELVEDPENKSLVGINTMATNKIVHEALINKKIAELSEFDIIKPESKWGDSRFDFYLTSSTNDKKCFVEVKNVTLLEDNMHQFPDAVTSRGKKHLSSLQKAYKEGFKAVSLFVVQRESAENFCIAKHIDPDYYNEMQSAINNNVKVICYNCIVSKEEITINKPLECIL